MNTPSAPRTVRRKRTDPKVIVTRQLLPQTERRMAELFDCTFREDDRPWTRDELAAALQACDVLVPTVTDRIDADLLRAAGDGLGLVASFGAGTDHIDLGAARARGIAVTNTPGVLTEATADLAMALIIAAPRRLGVGARMLHAGEWTGWGPSSLLGMGLGGRTLALVGMGRIGQAVARRARAFGLEIAYHNRRRLPAALEEELGARYEPDLDALLRSADIVSLHCPAAPETRHILDVRRIALLARHACVINTGRGDLIDEEALIDALEGGRIASAGLDVFAGEPRVNPRLLALPQVIALPHMGSAASDARAAAGERVIANIRCWADGHLPPDLVLDREV